MATVKQCEKLVERLTSKRDKLMADLAEVKGKLTCAKEALKQAKQAEKDACCDRSGKGKVKVKQSEQCDRADCQ